MLLVISYAHIAFGLQFPGNHHLWDKEPGCCQNTKMYPPALVKMNFFPAFEFFTVYCITRI